MRPTREEYSKRVDEQIDKMEDINFGHSIRPRAISDFIYQKYLSDPNSTDHQMPDTHKYLMMASYVSSNIDRNSVESPETNSE